MLNSVRVRVSLGGLINRKELKMFQVGDIVQVIIVPKKYKQYDITGATGIVKTVHFASQQL